MAKKKSVSSAHGKRTVRSERHIPDSQIDYSDIPESTDEELKTARRVGRPKMNRPPKQLIAIRIDPGLLRKLRRLAAENKVPYQSLIHELLEKATKDVA